MSDFNEHYEEDFKFPLWELIKKRADEKDISYVAAIEEVVPEYIKTIRYRDEAFENGCIQKRRQEFAELVKQKPDDIWGSKK
jgi:hypothetical protein